jgi:hypothetical protein
LEGSLTAGDIKVTVVEEDDHTEFLVRVLELEHLKVMINGNSYSYAIKIKKTYTYYVF